MIPAPALPKMNAMEGTEPMDALRFNADEIYQMAEDIEDHGSRFYEAARDAANKPEIRELLGRLAEMERNHKTRFTRMREELPECDQRNEISLSLEEASENSDYLKALAESRVFGKTEAKAIADLPENDLLIRALDLEKDSIIFLLELKEMAASLCGKDDIDTIIREELNHIRMINTQLAAWSKS